MALHLSTGSSALQARGDLSTGEETTAADSRLQHRAMQPPHSAETPNETQCSSKSTPKMKNSKKTKNTT